jgi:hypothetical protein
VKGPRRKHVGPDPYAPQRLKGGRYLGCRHLLEDGTLVGFDAKRAHKSKDPRAGAVTHHHDFG